MMTLRKRIFIAISIAVLILLALILIVLMARRRAAAPATPAGGGQTTGATAGLPAPQSPTDIAPEMTARPPTTEEMEKNAAKQSAKIFAERYGTYSTDNPYQNVRDVRSAVTDALWQKLSATIKPVPAGATFTGVTAQAISAALTDWQGNAATVAVGLRLSEDRAGQPTIRNQSMTIDLLKTADGWKVSGFAVE